MKFLLFIMPVLLLSSKITAQQGIYNASNEIFIEFIGDDVPLEFTSSHFASRLVKGDTQFEFVLPLNTVRPVNNIKDIQIFEAIFPPEPELLLYLTAEIPESPLNLMEFNASEDFVLDGVLTLFDENVRVPVTTSMYYEEGTLFFNLNFNFNLNLWEIPVPEKFDDLFTGEINMYVKDGTWSNFYLDR